MALPIFIPPVQPTATPGQESNVRPRRIVSKFGDGYSQRLGDGLNNMLATATLVWSPIGRPEADTIVAFMENRAEGQAFLYRLPNETVTRAWIFVEIQRSAPTSITDSLQISLEEVPDAE